MINKKTMILLLAALVAIGLVATMPFGNDGDSSKAETFNSGWTLDTGSNIISSNGTELFTVSISDKKVTITGLVSEDLENISVAFPKTVKDDSEVSYDVVAIGDYAFSDCESFNKIEIDSLTIGKGSFTESSVVSATIVGSVIKDNAFAFCSNLNKITITDVDRIGDYAFWSRTVKSTELTISNVKEFGNHSFSGRSYAVAPDLSSAVKIEGGAFKSAGCTLKIVGNTEMDFFGTSQNTQFDFSASNKYSIADGKITEKSPVAGTKPDIHFVYASASGQDVTLDLRAYAPNPHLIFGYSTLFPIEQVAGYKFKEIIFNDETTEVRDRQFKDCGAERIVMPGVTKIGFNALATPSLKNVVFGDKPLEIGESAFNGCRNLVDGPPVSTISIGKDCYWMCVNITSVNIPNLESMGQCAFQRCYKLETINTGAVGLESFLECGALRQVITGAKTIGNSAFEGCSRLESVTAPNLEEVGNSAFSQCGRLAKVPGNPTTIGNSAFMFSGVTELISQSVNVGVLAFWGCASLVKVNAAGTFGNGAFSCCENLKELRIAGTLGNAAFGSCIGIEAADISGVTEMGEKVFTGCTGLISITVPSPVPSIGKEAFMGCISIVSVSLPASVTAIDSSAFIGCSELKTISIDAGNQTYRVAGPLVYKTDGELFICAPGAEYAYITKDVTAIRGLGTDKMVFTDAEKLKKLAVDASNPNYSSSGGMLMSKDGTELIYVPTAMSSVDIPQKVVKIKAYSVCGYTAIVKAVGGSNLAIEGKAFATEYLSDIFIERAGDVTTEYSFYFGRTDVRISVTGDTVTVSEGKDVHIKANAAIVKLTNGVSGSTVEAENINISGLPSGVKASNKIIYGPAYYLIGNVTLPANGAGGTYNKYHTLYLSSPTEANMASLNGTESRVFTVGHAYDGNTLVKGHFMIRDGKILKPVHSEAGKDVYVDCPDGFTTKIVKEDGDAVLTLTSVNGYIASDLIVEAEGNAVQSTGGAYRYAFNGDVLFTVSVKEGGMYVPVTFKPNNGSADATVNVSSGMSIMPNEFPDIEYKKHRFVGWYTDAYFGTLYERSAVTGPLTLYAKWEGRNPEISVKGNGTFSSGNAVYTGSEFSGSPISISFTPAAGYKFVSWGAIGDACTCAIDGTVITVNGLTDDVTLNPLTFYIALSMEIPNPVRSEMQTEGTLIPTWEFRSMNMSMVGMAWRGMPSIPLIVEDRVYVRAGGVLYALSIEDGRVLNSAESSDSVSYYHTVGYACGKIIDDVMGNVYDLDLKPLYKIKPTNCAMEHNGFIYAFSDDKVMKYSPEPGIDMEEDGKTKKNLQANEISGISPYGAWGQTVAPKFVGDYVYTMQAIVTFNDPDYGRIFVNAANLSTGEKKTIELTGMRYRFIDDTCFSYYGGYLYVTSYTKGIFNKADDRALYRETSITPIKVNGVDLIVLTPTKITANIGGKPVSITGYASQFVVSNGNGFFSAGGQITVFDINKNNGKLTMKMFDSGNPWISNHTSHGGITVDDRRGADNLGKVYIFKVPYKPVECVVVFEITFNADNTISGKTTNMPSTAYNYGSQAVRAGPNGEMVYYNDDGVVHCYRPIAKDPFRYLVLDGGEGYAFTATGTVKESIRADSSLILNPYGAIMRNGKAMNVFALGSDGTWKKVDSMNSYSYIYKENYGITVYYPKTFVLTDSETMPELGSPGGAGWYATLKGATVRLDITDLESARSLNRAGLTWYDSEPTGIVAPKKVVVNIGETVSFEASSDVEITWAAGNPDTVLLVSLKNGHTVRLTGKAIGETVLIGTSGVHTFEVAVSVVSNTTETEADGTVVKTSRFMEVLADGTVAESTLTVRTSSDGDSVETLEVTYSKNGSVTGYYRKITSSDVSDEQGKAVYDINVEETSKDAGGNVTSSSESSEHRLIWTDSKGFAMTESHIVKVSGGLRTQIDSLIKATGNKTDTTETVIVTKSDGTPVSSESTRTIAKPAASAVRKESGGKVTAMAYGNIPEALALAAEIGGDFVMELRESTGAADLRAIADAGCTAEFSAAGLTVRLSASDLRQVAAKGDAVISVSIVNHSDLPANAASDLVGFTVYGVSFKAGGADMVFSSDVAVTAPYAGAAGRLAVHSVGATGGLSKISATSAGGTASFGVKEFGRIAVGEAAQKPSEPPASNSVTGVTMASSASVEVGGVITLRASVSPSNASNKALMWTSDNPSVASVDSGGSVTANGVGTATITATTVEGGYRASCTVTVKAAYTKEIDVNPSADGNVSQSQMDAAVVKVQNAKAADPSSNPVVDVESSSSTVTVPASGMSGLAEAGATLKVTTGNATVEFGSAVLGNMSKNSGTTLKIEVVKVDKGTLSESQRDKVGDGIVIDVNVTVGTTKVHQLGGKVKVSVPYELKPGQDAGNLKVWYLNDNGTLEEIPCTYDAKSKTVVFETGHFSKFAVMYAETAVDDTAPATDWTIIAIVAVVLVLAIAVAGVMFRRRSAV